MMKKTIRTSESRPVVRLNPLPKRIININFALLAVVALLSAGLCSVLLAGCGSDSSSAPPPPTSKSTPPPKLGAPGPGSYENWMRDLAPVIGQRPLRQVVIPGSHDAATFGPWGFFEQGLAQAQTLDITDQLNAGSRFFDLRFEYRDYNGNADYWNFHGIAVSQYVRLGQVLGAIVDWSEQHPQEILLLNVSFGDNYGSNPDLLKKICSQTLGSDAGKALVLQPSMVPQFFGAPWPYDMSMNEIWALPGHPRIITDWADCTGGDWERPDIGLLGLPFVTRYADRCASAQAVIDGLAPSLDARTGDGGDLAQGMYALFVQATPELECLEAALPSLAPLQGDVLTAIKGWRQQNQNKALANLNVIAGDFLGTTQGDTQWPIVQTAIDLNKTAPAPQLTQSTAQKGVDVSCTGPPNIGLQMMAYPLTEGKVGLDSVRYYGNSPGQLDLVRDQFPPGKFDVRVDCTTTQGVTSSLTVAAQDLPGEGCRYRVGGLIKAQGGAEIDVMAPGCQRRDIPNVTTLDQMKATWVSNAQVLTPADFSNLAQGAAIPDYTTDAHGFDQAMQDIYGARCFSNQVNVGTLIQLIGWDGFTVLGGGCAQRIIPNVATLQAIENRYNIAPQSFFPGQLYITGNPNGIPDYTTNMAGFNQAMQEIYGH